MTLFPWLLLLHVLAALIAIGPNFAYATIRGMGRKEPQHANFATRVSHEISDRLVISRSRAWTIALAPYWTSPTPVEN